MTHTTPSIHPVDDRQLSARAALRTLRRIAYGEWDAFRSSAGVPATTIAVGEVIWPNRDVPAISEGWSIWYLNEVPADWIDETDQGPWATGPQCP